MLTHFLAIISARDRSPNLFFYPIPSSNHRAPQVSQTAMTGAWHGRLLMQGFKFVLQRPSPKSILISCRTTPGEPQEVVATIAISINLSRLLAMLSIFAISLLALSAVGASMRTARPTSPVVGAWYAGWHATEGFPLSSVSWKKYNTLYYSFA
jgi:hypothetical protein